MDKEAEMAGQEATVQPAVETITATAGGAGKAPEAARGNGQPLGLEALKPGTQLKGKVRNIVEFGAFIDIGVGRDGLAHVSVLKRAGVDKTLKVGDTIDVVVRRIDPEDNRISLALPSPNDKSGKTPLRDLQVNAVVTGHVVRLVDYGAFVDIGAQTDGLLHVSQLPWGYVNRPSEVLKVGDEVQVRIQEVDSRKRRISLTMKAIETPDAKAAPEPAKGPEERLPTAFKVAFEKARQVSRRRRASA